MNLKRVVYCATVPLLLAIPPAFADRGGATIEGRVLQLDGAPVGGVDVLLVETGAGRITDVDGSFAFSNLDTGDYSLELTLGRNTRSLAPLAVTAGATTRLEETVDWALTFGDAVTVFSASRRRERIFEAPASVVSLPEPEIEREAASGQLPKLLEFTPGTEIAQGGLYEFNLNVRGFNDPFNRRLLTLIDGRDVSLPSLGSQEWPAISFPLDDLAGVELVRGPGSALYGADAFNGALNLTTKAPRYSQGGKVRLTAGELDTRKLDLRYATGLSDHWYLKAVGGYTESDDFFRSRVAAVEYSVPCTQPGQFDCLPLEAVPPVLQEDKIFYGSLRLDRTLGGDKTLVVEAGTSDFEGPVQVTEFGRLQLTDVVRPWTRVNFNSLHWNVLGYYTGREGNGQTFLNIDYPFYTDSDRVSLELQGNSSFAGGRGFVVGGVSAMEETLDSAGPSGVQTVTFRKRDEDFQAVFGQIEYDITDKLKGVFAARWDDTSLHDSQFSPRGSLVYALRPDQTLRASFSEAFLTPSYVNLFLYLPVLPPVPLQPLEGICAMGGVACGFDQPVQIRSLGNEDLEVEEIRSFELGYNAVIGKRTFLTLDYFNNQVENFISDFISFFNPGLGGRIHDNYPAYQPPAALPPPLAAALLGTLQANLPPELFAILSTGADGEPLFALLSAINFGRVDTRGFELALTHPLATTWTLDLGYAYYDFDVKDRIPEDPALPNTAKNKANLSVTYVGDRFDAALRYRWSESFDWSAGFYRSRVPSYQVADLTVNHRFDDSWSLGLDVSNVFDESHFEFFGGDLLERRALAHVTFSF
ncbi:MAG: TonB-dependent receptor [bacterium]|nr:TonB-dependent receptor [bacterium]